MRQLMVMIFLLSFKQACAQPSAQVFVSFSIPPLLLEATLREAALYQIPVYLNGLLNNSMPETANRILELSKKVPNLNLLIDPTAFERFRINQVPAIVVENKETYDVLYGHLSLKTGLERIKDIGETKLTFEDLKEIIGE